MIISGIPNCDVRLTFRRVKHKSHQIWPPKAAKPAVIHNSHHDASFESKKEKKKKKKKGQKGRKGQPKKGVNQQGVWFESQRKRSEAPRRQTSVRSSMASNQERPLAQPKLNLKFSRKVSALFL